ncbi:MAG TPA: glycosyltransferase family 2 protein [Vicinamibacterales bacterium]|nr:glycosyltransferase family 2 protein [Vicinamibacterales bacterium]
MLRPPLNVVAIISAYNEADIIQAVIAHLIDQGVSVYLIDDGSTDDTVVIASAFLGRGLIGLEQRDRGNADDVFSWTDVLRRKEQLASTLEADWFIHHDADEFRESPWPATTLAEAIARVDALAFNAIDFHLLDFRPTEADATAPNADVRERQRHFQPAAPWNVKQVKCWKRTESVDLLSSGGHDASFRGRVIYPVKFVLRHYPFRNETQGARKVFIERKPRFLPDEIHRGWHVQYDSFTPGMPMQWSATELTLFDGPRVRKEIIERAVSSEAARWLLQRTEMLTDSVRSLEQERHQATETIAALEARLGHERFARDEALRNARAQHDGVLAARNALAARLRETYDSRSWRLTKPLRGAYSRLTGQLEADEAVPAVAIPKGVQWGDLARVTPFSDSWGTDRGLPIDRYYIEAFLRDCRGDITDAVLEVKDPGYAHAFGSDLTQVDVIDVTPSNTRATIVADLAVRESLPANTYHCFICTQTLHITPDIRASVAGAVQVLKPGGVLLCSIPAISRVNYEDGGLSSGDYWRLTAAAVAWLFRQEPDLEEVDIRTAGNIQSCTAFLYGLAAEELPREVLEFQDPWFPLLHCVRAVKR